MAKSKKEDVIVEVATEKKYAVSAKSIMNNLKKGNKLFSSIDVMSSDADIPKEYIDTGSFALNRIISGDYRKGIPVGKITAFAGEPSTGKSFLCERLIRNAVNSGFIVYLIDTEDSYNEEKLRCDGIDTDQVILEKDARTITDTKNICIPRLRAIREQSPEAKILVIIDSLAALATEKQLNDDIDKGKVGHDQGMKAKDMKLLSTVFLQEIRSIKFTMVVTNHIYLKPGQNPSIPPEQCFTGGSGWVYACSTIIFLSKKQQKQDYDAVEKNEFSEKTKTIKPTGMFIFAVTKKNRFIPEGHLAEIYINFTHGLNKLYGIGEDAAEFGYIEKVHGGVVLKKSGKKIKDAELYKNENWDFFDELADKVYQKLKFKPIQNMADIDALVGGANELTEESEESKESVKDPDETPSDD